MKPWIIVLNLGSTSLKFKIMETSRLEDIVAEGEVAGVGGAESESTVRIGDARYEDAFACPDCIAAFDRCVGELTRRGVIDSLNDVRAVGYKAVHGGELSGARIVDESVLSAMEAYADFAPAHNPVYIAMMRHVGQKYPGLKQIACFETAFHTSVPTYRRIYGVPYEWSEQYSVKRYGFHGSSHSYIAWKMQQCAPEARRVLSVHLGGSSSVCAIGDGKSVATSMGATPQSGLFHNNRAGDFDAFCLPKLCRAYGGLDPVLAEMSHRGGFLGITGESNDLREVLRLEKSGNARAKLAIDTFVDNILGYIGMYTAYLGGADAIVFTGGIGWNSAEIRKRVCEKCTFLSVKLDDSMNEAGKAERIDAPGSGVEVWRIKTNEELSVARQMLPLL